MSVDDIRQATFDAILETGMAVHSCANGAWGGAAVSYTVGRAMKERPELMVTGVPAVGAEALLRMVAEIDDVRMLVDGDTVAITMDRVLRVVESNPGPMIGAVLTFGPTVPVLQLVWPFPDGTYPSSVPLDGRQPVYERGITPGVDWDPYGE